jgi:hypothetical protein
MLDGEIVLERKGYVSRRVNISTIRKVMAMVNFWGRFETIKRRNNTIEKRILRGMRYVAKGSQNGCGMNPLLKRIVA